MRADWAGGAAWDKALKFNDGTFECCGKCEDELASLSEVWVDGFTLSIARQLAQKYEYFAGTKHAEISGAS